MTLVYFTDRDLGNRFPAILRKAGLAVEQHSNHFAPTTPDDEWLEVIGSHGWVALTRDRRIRYKPNQRDAVIRHGVALLVIVGKAHHADLAHSFVATRSRIEAFLSRHRPPFIAKVYRSSPAGAPRPQPAPGRIELWYPRRS